MNFLCSLSWCLIRFLFRNAGLVSRGNKTTLISSCLSLKPLRINAVEIVGFKMNRAHLRIFAWCSLLPRGTHKGDFLLSFSFLPLQSLSLTNTLTVLNQIWYDFYPLLPLSTCTFSAFIHPLIGSSSFSVNFNLAQQVECRLVFFHEYCSIKQCPTERQNEVVDYRCGSSIT